LGAEISCEQVHDWGLSEVRKVGLRFESEGVRVLGVRDEESVNVAIGKTGESGVFVC
jgi:hypothetical protein